MARSNSARCRAARLRKSPRACCATSCRANETTENTENTDKSIRVLRVFRGSIPVMRIVAGEWRGRTLLAPAGSATRPTADRVRQALFDMLLHAPWGGRALIEDARVLDVFAGTGAFGLEALSRGAAHATFVEHDRAALAALRANIAACRAEKR